jgi:hypothetical protein
MGAGSGRAVAEVPPVRERVAVAVGRPRAVEREGHVLEAGVGAAALASGTSFVMWTVVDALTVSVPSLTSRVTG